MTLEFKVTKELLRPPKRAIIPPFERIPEERKGPGRNDGSPLSVGVFIDLRRGADAGGHVKCWERFSEAAAQKLKGRLDLTIHFLGNENSIQEVSQNVRYVEHRPAFSTSLLPFMDSTPAHTDLAPLHLGVLPYLNGYDVLHTTDAFFALSKTALHFARRRSRPLVNSIHTDTPNYTRVFARKFIERLVGVGRLGRFLLERLRISERAGDRMQRKLDRYLERCDWVMVSKNEDLDRVKEVLPGKEVSLFRRGVDRETFHPRMRNRRKVMETFRIHSDRFLVLFAGRVDEAKNVMTLARAVRLLQERGRRVQLVVVGKGAQEGAIRKLLGPAATLTGVVPQATLASLYASADLFAFPSQTEVCPNVVIEAKACGLPAIVSRVGGAGDLIKKEEPDGLVAEDDTPAAWAGAIDRLMKDREALSRMARRARETVEREWPSWGEILERDLFPVWKTVAGSRAGAGKAGTVKALAAR